MKVLEIAVVSLDFRSKHKITEQIFLNTTGMSSKHSAAKEVNYTLLLKPICTETYFPMETSTEIVLLRTGTRCLA